MVEHKDAFGSVCIPDDWSLIPLGKCVTEKLSYGINAPAIPFDGKSPAYIRITDITEDGRFDNSDRKAVQTHERDKYLLREGDIVLARTGASTGKTYLYNEKDGELVYAGFLIKASIDLKQHNPRFIVGQLRTLRYWSWVAAMSMRSGQPGINGKEYSSFLVPVAPKKEQDAIANILSEFDIHITNLAELIEKKKAIRDGALEDLVSGKTRLTGYGEGWTEKKLGDFLKIGRGASPRPIEAYLTQNPNGVNWIKIGDAPRHGKYIVHTEEKITPAGALHSVPVNDGDFILSNSMSFGRPYILSVSGCIHDGWLKLHDYQESADKEFLYYLLSSATVKEQYETYAAGSGVQNLNKNVVKQVVVKLPPVEEQKAIATVLSSMDLEIDGLEDEREKMIQVREGAMDDLLSGRVRLSV